MSDDKWIGVHIRLRPWMHEELKKRAAREGTQLAIIVRQIVQEALEANGNGARG